MEEKNIYEVKCEKCGLIMWESSEKEENRICGDCAKEMSQDQLQGKVVEAGYPVKCFNCKKPIDFKDESPEEREDVEICTMTYEGDVEGKHFCSSDCFKKYVKRLFEDTQVIAKEKGGKFSGCSVCGEEVNYPSHSLDFYGKDGESPKIFCSDKCLREGLKGYM